MRTTLDLTDESYAVAKALARERDQGLGRTVSELILAGALSRSERPPAWTITEENGWPVVELGRVVTSEEVREFLDEE